MVGIVIVSHCAALASGLHALAGSMAQGRVQIAVAAGIEDDDTILGTDPVRIQQAITSVWSDDGVLVLMDLGSAVLSAEMALEMLPAAQRARVRLCAAPLVEGTVAAVAQAAGGQSLARVESEALAALAPKAAQLGSSLAVQAEAIPPLGLESLEARGPLPVPADTHGASGGAPVATQAPFNGGTPDARTARAGIVAARTVVRQRFGLHARPAARFVTAAAHCPVEVRVYNLTRRAGPVSARSINQVMTLGIRQGDEIELTAVNTEEHDVEGALRTVLAALTPGHVAGNQSLASRSVPPPGKDTALPAEAMRGARSTAPPGGPRALSGLPASPGIAIGQVRRLQEAHADTGEKGAESPEDAWERLERALAQADAELSVLQADTALRLGEAAEGIFAAHVLMLRDPVLLARARALVHGEARGAGEAWRQAVAELRQAWDEVDDRYLRERVADLDDVADRVNRHLASKGPGRVGGETGAPRHGEASPGGASAPADDGSPEMGVAGPQAAIIVAVDLAPSAAARLRPESTLGVCLARGTPLSHAVILARALGIPAVVGAGPAILEVPEGTTVALDGDTGHWWIDPERETLADLAERRRHQAAIARLSRQHAATPAYTRDGRLVPVRANVGSCAPSEMEALLSSGADGVGLLRTEFLFLARTTPPSEEEQVAVYEALAEALGEHPLVIRTVDIGGDKPVPYLDLGQEANPFLGWRGIRQSLDLPTLLETQLRAILRAAARRSDARSHARAGRRVRLMFPMVASVREVRAAREAVAHARESLDNEGVAHADVEIGIMIEVPAAALMADQMAPPGGLLQHRHQ